MNNVSLGDYKHLSDECIKYYKDIFDEVSNNKKYITFDQFKKIVLENGYVADKYELGDLKDEINNGYNGKLDFIYYLVLISRMYREFHQERFKESILHAFKTINNTGNITKGELYNFFMSNKNHTTLTIDEIDNLFEYIDDDNNGIIELNEIINVVNNLF